MTKKVRAILDQIDDVLCKMDQDAADLWAIIGAQRSCDEPLSHGWKDTYTLPIRGEAFPKLKAIVVDIRASTPKWPHDIRQFPGMGYNNPKPLPTQRALPSEDCPHYFAHIADALTAINREDEPS